MIIIHSKNLDLGRGLHFNIRLKGQGLRQKEAACTIVTKNYFAKALTLAHTYLHHNPKSKLYLLAADDAPSNQLFIDSRVVIINLSKLAQSYPILTKMSFEYPAMSLICTLKYFLLNHLIEDLGYERAIYLDSDIYVAGSLAPQFKKLVQAPILVTPHLLDSSFHFEDERIPNEHSILRTGVFNTGFIGVSKSEVGKNFLKWIRRRVSAHCKHDIAEGHYYDQNLFDYVPVYFPECHIVRDAGCNVAYWNLHEREISLEKSIYKVNGEPLIFFHFSGYDPANPHQISTHQMRFSLQSNPSLKRLFDVYRASLTYWGHGEFSKLSYGHGRFDNGLEIPDLVRDLYRRISKTSRDFSNPFKTEDVDSFFNWLVHSSHSLVPPLVLAMREKRLDVVTAIPDITSEAGQLKVLEWADAHGVSEMGMSWRWRKIISLCRVLAQAKTKLAKEAAVLNARPATRFKGPISFGVNLTGDGIGFKKSLQCLKVNKIPHVLNNFKLGHLNFLGENPFNINLVHIDPDSVNEFFKDEGLNFIKSRFNIGYWNKKSNLSLEELSKRANLFDEIWVPSEFVKEELTQFLTVPVFSVPPCIEIQKEKTEKVPLPSEIARHDFIFLNCFDFKKGTEEENPLGVIQAFKKAFIKQSKACLIMKSVHGQLFESDLNRLKKHAQGFPIYFIDEYLKDSQFNGLLEMANVTVSLHRVKSIALTLLESMARGKPVIATSYSGNLDYMNSENSFLVPCTIKKTLTQSLAEPDLESAARLMKWIYENRSDAIIKAQKARSDVLQKFNAKVIGRIYDKRLSAISRGHPRRA